MKDLVSIIIPVFNTEDYLKRCISSVLNQSYFNIQIIVVNDGSTDNSDEIIKEFARKDSRVVYIKQKNSGVGYARNIGIKRAEGKYLLFVDSDDYIEKTMVEQMVNCAEKGNSDLVICGYILVDSEGKELERVIPQKYVSKENEEWAYRISSTMARLYKKELFDKYQLCFTEERNARGEDVPIVLFTNCMAQNIQLLKEANYYYVQHEGSAMHTFAGLQKYTFPYQAMLDIGEKLQDQQTINSREFFAFGVLKFFAYFQFVLARNAKKEKKKELLSFFVYYIKRYIPNYKECYSHVKKRHIDMPIYYLCAVRILMFILRWRMLFTERKNK